MDNKMKKPVKDLHEFTHAGLECWIVPHGGWKNGYVAVEKDHPYFGKEYTSIDDEIEVHGGLTFSDEFVDGDKTLWVFGFDTAHSGDIWEGQYMTPYMQAYHKLFSSDVTHWTDEKLVEEIKILAEQLAKKGQHNGTQTQNRQDIELFVRPYSSIGRSKCVDIVLSFLCIYVQRSYGRKKQNKMSLLYKGII